MICILAVDLFHHTIFLHISGETGTMNYYFQIANNEFSLETASGVLRTKVPMPEYVSYVMYVVAQDNMQPYDQSP